MMKLIGSASNPWRASAIPRVSRIVFYSAEARPSPSPGSDSLYRRISGVGDPNTSMVPLLDQWLQEGRTVRQNDLYGIIKQLRKYRRFTHALQVQEWMTNKMNYEIKSGGVAVRLDLISKLHDLEKAEEYFNSISSSLRDNKVYGAMLNCYADKRSVKKADDLFQKMKELGYSDSDLAYNVMLSLYSRTGNHDKIDTLVQEMKEKGVTGTAYTFNIRLNAYAETDVEKMEKLFTEMEADSKVDLYGYFTAFKGYMKAGHPEKALPMARKSEELIKIKGHRIDYEHLITLYSSAGMKDEVFRIWNLYKNMGRVFNTGYLSMLSSLLRLDDIDGVDKIFEEWESGTTGFDARIANLIIVTYCKKGLVEKAYACAERLTSRGNKLNGYAWHWLAMKFCAEGLMPKAVETMRKAILARGPRSRLNRSTLAACLEYLKREGDKEAAHEMLRLVREKGCFPSDVCDRLVEFVNSDQDSGALAAMEENKQSEDETGVAADEK